MTVVSVPLLRGGMASAVPAGSGVASSALAILDTACPGSQFYDDKEETAAEQAVETHSLFRWYGAPGHGTPRNVAAFEQEFAKVMGVKYVLGVTSGTAALHCALTALGVGPGDEVILPIDALNTQCVGYYFGVCHATADGGVRCWKSAMNLAGPRLKMVAIKDFRWEKTATEGWHETFCPLGEGMVDWKYYFKALAQTGFQGPISLHLEYAIPGATTAEKEANTLKAGERDLAFVKARLHESYG